MALTASIGNKCRSCRREGLKLFLKGKRCLGPTCPIDRKGAVAPGVSAGTRTRRTRVSDYGRQLREKQKVRRFYGVDEKQLKRYFAQAKKSKGQTAEVLIQLLESRLDNIVFRLGFAPSRRASKQLVVHGNVIVNGKRVDIPSFRAKEGDTVTLSTKALKIPQVEEVLGTKSDLPGWLERKAVVGRIKRLPVKDDVDFNADQQVIVEYYSK